ncbi:MAG: CsbD family protein [Nitrosomonas sp.]
MNKDQVKGRIKEAQGKVKEVIGKVLDDKKMEVEGILQKKAGRTQAGLSGFNDEVKREIAKQVNK